MMSDFSQNDKDSKGSVHEKKKDNMIPESTSEDEEEEALDSNRKLLNKIEFD